MSSGHWSLRLLGGFALEWEGNGAVRLDTARGESLIAYLALHRNAPQPRQHVAFVFWPDSTESRARNNLRQLVFQLRHALPDDALFDADANALRWHGDGECDVDIVAFHDALERAAQAAKAGRATDELAALDLALGLYSGDLLPACYDDWIAPERQNLHDEFLAALRRAIALRESKRAFEPALRLAQRLAQLEPLDESACAAIMRLHASKGDRASALRAYHDFAASLQHALGIAPGDDLQAQAARLKTASVTALAAHSDPPTNEKSGALPMIGRDNEWRRLLDVWHRAELGRAQFALITGEPGIGKSRLAEELQTHLAQHGIAVGRTRAYAAEGRLSFAPVTEWLRSPAVRAALSVIEPMWLSEVARLLPELLSRAGVTPPSPFTEYWQRQHFFEALARATLAVRAPLLLVLDDAQWCDAETIEWLRYLLRFDSRAKLLVVAAARAEEIATAHALNALLDALRRDDQLTEIALSALDASETAKIAALVAGRALNDAQATRLFHESEGNPLFVVEMMRAGIDSDADNDAGKWASDEAGETTKSQRLAHSRLPPKVYSVISSRLGQLSPTAREVAGLAATVGRAFSSDVLGYASDLSDAELASALDELWQRKIVREAGDHGHGVAFDFGHDKIRDVAYTEISPFQRRRLHLRVAQALERANANGLDAVSAQIANHFETAGAAAEAVAYYRRAASVSQQLYAYDDAIALLRRGLTQAAKIGDPAERASQELQLFLDLAPPIRVTFGWASPELETPLQRAWEMSQRVGTSDQQTRAQLSLSYFHEVRAEFAQARQLTENLLARSDVGDASAYIAMARVNTVGWLTQTRHWREVDAEYRRVIEAYAETQHAQQVALFGVDIGVLNLAWSAHALWFLGLADQALRRGHEAEALANRLDHPFSQALAMSYLAMQHAFRREFDRTLEYARRARDFSSRHNVGYYRAWADVLMSWAIAKQQPGVEAVAAVQRALDGFRATGGRIRLTFYLSLLAECLGDIGEVEAALAALGEAFDFAEQTGEHWVDAELHRLRGELLRRHGANTAEDALQTALDIAREQGARLLELRAALSLTKLRRASPDFASVSIALSKLDEGLDQPDVRETRALLRGKLTPRLTAA